MYSCTVALNTNWYVSYVVDDDDDNFAILWSNQLKILLFIDFITTLIWGQYFMLGNLIEYHMSNDINISKPNYYRFESWFIKILLHFRVYLGIMFGIPNMVPVHSRSECRTFIRQCIQNACKGRNTLIEFSMMYVHWNRIVVKL